MISFRKRAYGNTGCSISFLGGRAPRSNPSLRLAALVVILLLAAAGAFASPRQRKAAKPQSDEPAAGAPQKPARKAAGRGDDGDGKIPVHVSRLDTPDGPYIVATIGDFPSDLDGRRQEFLGRDFFERVASDVLGIGDHETGATLKMAMLPQEKDDRREGDFTFGELSGHMIVLVEKRRVIVACSFAEAEAQPKLLAATGRLAGGRALRRG